ncbi:AbgT family transporter [Temperatibacter marinus]|uniref:AbgT family transporter n=1 Tax=Temperatibacter marinus TaxID=1456591 RepID=A0AA52ECA3_9PROT|nr:AbgT family transporter [Temperatibacter marinus]WND02762.1 AbgT family transporter [Temperatibacter marinus]
MSDHQPKELNSGILGWIERTGNRLPDPVFLFLWLILFLVIASVLLSSMGVSALHPTIKDSAGNATVIAVSSLLSAENIEKLFVDMPKTMTHFHPLGYVLIVMLGAGVAERTGLFSSAMRAGVASAPKMLLTPVVALVAMIANLAADAAYVVLIPLAGILFASAGRHPIAGIAAAFAGVSGGFSANLLPGQLDALLFGITESAVELLVPTWDANIAGNWYFIMAMTFVFLPIIWYVTDKIVEPRLGKFNAKESTIDISAEDQGRLSEQQRKGLKRAGLAVLAVIAFWVYITLGPGTPLIDESAVATAQLSPFYKSLVAGFFVMFLLAGWAYGSAVGTVKDHRDVVTMMADSMKDMAYYLVIVFTAAHFVVMFNWSNMGIILAINGAEFLGSTDLPMPVLIGLMILIAAMINIFVGSASAKWAILAPVMVPMFMLLGVSPEMATAAYRMGDGATNIITPLMFYFPLILAFCQRWKPEFGLGSLTAMMIPYSIWMLVLGLLMTMTWIGLDLPLGPGASASYVLPGK